MKRFFSAAGILLLILFLLRFPGEALNASKEGLGLWLNTLIPVLLPFMILTDLLIHTGMLPVILMPLKDFWKFFFGISPQGAYALLAGLLCGYPMGAKITSELYSCQQISKREAEYLLTFTNHPSPVFLKSYLIHCCLKDQASPLMVFGTLWLAGILTMLFFRFFIWKGQTISQINSAKNQKKEPSAPGITGTLLDASIMNGFETITRLGGYLLLFSILSAMIRHYGKTGAAGYLIPGMLELTTGLHLLADAALPFHLRYLCAMPMAAFGGVCILAQTRSLLNKELSILPYVSAKCLNAAITAVLSLVFLQII